MTPTGARGLLLEAIDARRTGALVVAGGRGMLYLLLGEPHHAVVSGTSLSGLAAAREVGRLAGGPASRAAWRSDEALGAGRSLTGVAPAQLVTAFDDGQAAATAGLPEMVERACAVVAATLHRHGAAIEADLRTASSPEQLSAVVASIAARTVRGVRPQTLEDLALRVAQSLAPS